MAGLKNKLDLDALLQICEKVFYFGLFVFAGYICYKSVCLGLDHDKAGITVQFVLLMLGYLLLFSLVVYVVARMKERTADIFIKCCIAVAFMTMLFIAYEVRAVPKVDLSHIIDQGMEMIENESPKITDVQYFGFNINNIPLMILVYWVFRVGKALGCADLRLAGGVFHSILLSAMLLSVYYILKKFVNEKLAVLLTFFLTTNPLIYAYAPFYYTDTISVSVLMISLALSSKAVSIGGGGVREADRRNTAGYIS